MPNAIVSFSEASELHVKLNTGLVWS